MAFKILYHEDALADLEEIFEWSREKHPETTEQFANDLFDHLELLQALPYVTPRRSPLTFQVDWAVAFRMKPGSPLLPSVQVARQTAR